MNEFFDKKKALQIILDIAYHKGISQAQLIEGIYDYSHFNRMCNGKENIKIDILVLCCIKLDISFDKIIQLSKEKPLLELDAYYNQFEIIRQKRNYNELSKLYQSIISNKKIKEFDKYKQLATHILAIIEGQNNHNFEAAKHLLEQAFELSGYSIQKYNQFHLTKEQVEILIDYSICCFSLNDLKWQEILLYLKENKNNFVDEETFDYMYPKVSYNISTMFLTNKNYSKSLIHSEEAIQFCRYKNNFIYLPYLCYHSACCLSILKKYSQAKEYLDNSKIIFKLQNHLDEFQKTYQADYQTYFSHGDFAI